MQRQARDKLGSARKTHPTKRGVLCCVQVRRICGFSVANLARRLCKVACGTLHPGSFARRCDIVYEFNKPFCFRAAVKQFLMQADHSPRQARGETQRNILSIHTTELNAAVGCVASSAAGRPRHPHCSGPLHRALPLVLQPHRGTHAQGKHAAAVSVILGYGRGCRVEDACWRA